MDKAETQRNLLEHSAAKVALYGKYLSVFLNVLSRVRFVRRILLFDLMCGEGIYADGGKGSPIVALEAIKNHYFANNRTCPDCLVWLNDNGVSLIEKDRYMIDRVEEAASGIFRPPNVEVHYFREDYSEILEKALSLSGGAQASKSLFFIDPHGYKMILPSDIGRLLERGNSEVLLFLPISQMYRFASAAVAEPFSGGEPLANFLQTLFKDRPIKFDSAADFIAQLKDAFRDYLRSLRVFVDTFTIVRGAGLIYCLFFFTRNSKGFQKMVEVKWSLDKDSGAGFDPSQQQSFLTAFELEAFEGKLESFLRGALLRTNREILEFTTEHGYVASHANSILTRWLKDDPTITVRSVDGRSVLPTRAYIGNDDRRVELYFEGTLPE